MPARILFVLPNFAGGGAERVAMTLLAELDSDLFEAQLVVLDSEGPLKSLLPKNAEFFELGEQHLRHALPALVKLIRRQRPRVVFASQGYLNMGLLAARPFMPRQTKLALRESNTPSQSLPNRRYPGLMGWAYRRLYPKVDLLFCQHRQTEREMVEVFGVAADRIVSLPNPVPLARLRADAVHPLRQPGTGSRFIAAGRLHRQKGFDRLIELFAALPDNAQLTIYGEGHDREALQRQIDSLALNQRITLAGFTRSPAAALAGADACLLSSRWEGLPNIALEALACGTPVIATPESGGIAELAKAAPPGAVSIAPWGKAFLAKMANCPQRHLQYPANSLLPAHYALDKVAEGFNGQLSDLILTTGNPTQEKW